MNETEKIKLVVEMRDRAYAQRLAQRLCELCSGLEIEICGKGEFCEWNDTADGYRLYGGCDIVLSDRELSSCGLPEDITFLKLQRKECFLPVPRILEMLAIAYEQKTGKSFLLKPESAARILSFCADQGGAGVTAVSLTMARLLAGMQDGRVLYLELVPPDALQEKDDSGWQAYTCITEPPLRPVAELEYRLRCMPACRLQPYLARDSSGLYYLRLHRDTQLLEKLLACSGDFDWILADCGTGAPVSAQGRRFHICNVLDRRSQRSRKRLRCAENEESETAEGEIVFIENRSTGYHSSNGACALSEDPDSFLLQDENATSGAYIEISQQGNFARDIRRLAKRLNFFAYDM